MTGRAGIRQQLRNSARSSAAASTWTQRHILVLAGAALYLPAIAVCVATQQGSLELATTYLLVILLLGVLSVSPKIDPAVRQTLAAGALLTANVSLIEASGRALVAHLCFGFALVLVALYQSAPLQLFATTYVVFYYLILGAIAPALIYGPGMLLDRDVPWGAALCTGAVLASLPAIAAWSINSNAARDAEALRVALAEAALRERQASELNDTVMQDLVTALYATESGDTATATTATRRAVESARSLVDSLLSGTGTSIPGRLTREEPAQQDNRGHEQ